MANFCFCAHCNSDLRGPAIPSEYLKYYGNENICRYGCGQPSHYSRLIGVYDIRTDRTEFWQCPDCGHEEARRG